MYFILFIYVKDGREEAHEQGAKKKMVGAQYQKVSLIWRKCVVCVFMCVSMERRCILFQLQHRIMITVMAQEILFPFVYFTCVFKVFRVPHPLFVSYQFLAIIPKWKYYE